MSGPLGRREPTDWRHVEKYPLQLTAFPEVIGQPLVFGVVWYSAFDTPIERQGKFGTTEYWLPEPNQDWGHIRGGHAICAEPAGRLDRNTWWSYYEQPDGSCVGFSISRMQSLNNREKYAAHDLYEAAQEIDEWPGSDYEGTSVRAGFDVLRDQGIAQVRGRKTYQVDMENGVLANRWLTNVDEMLVILGREHVVWLQSWGRGYPHRVRVSPETIARLMNENGECVVSTDR